MRINTNGYCIWFYIQEVLIYKQIKLKFFYKKCAM
jgi:hypothetical protein